MILDGVTIRSMRPSAVLALVRDALASHAAATMTLERDLVRLGFDVQVNAEQVAKAAVFAAGADVLTGVIAFGQDIALSVKDKPEWVKEKRDEDRWRSMLVERQKWAVALADQARAALLEHFPAISVGQVGQVGQVLDAVEDVIDDIRDKDDGGS